MNSIGYIGVVAECDSAGQGTSHPRLSGRGSLSRCGGVVFEPDKLRAQHEKSYRALVEGIGFRRHDPFGTQPGIRDVICALGRVAVIVVIAKGNVKGEIQILVWLFECGWKLRVGGGFNLRII